MKLWHLIIITIAGLFIASIALFQPVNSRAKLTRNRNETSCA